MAKRLIMYCTACGSADDMRQDAWAAQCHDGSWELGDCYDGDVWCGECDAENEFDFKEIEIETSPAADPAGDPPAANPA